jgi:glycerophosphoryl diester phosphodiesterase
VNEPKKMLHAAEMGVDGIISDDPALLIATLRETKN